MPENRFYVPSAQMQQDIFKLEDAEAKHLFVMRPQIGTEIELIDGKGNLALAEIQNVTKSAIDVRITSRKKEPENAFELIIAQALPRLNRLDFILEKGTELGMTELWLFPGERSEKREVNQAQEQRMQHLMIASIKQCGRLYLPRIKMMPPLKKWLTPPYQLLFGDLRSGASPLIKTLSHMPNPAGTIFLVGPEKGLSLKELEHIESMGGQGVVLSPYTLRSDTAPIAALSLLSQLYFFS